LVELSKLETVRTATALQVAANKEKTAEFLESYLHEFNLFYMICSMIRFIPYRFSLHTNNRNEYEVLILVQGTELNTNLSKLR